MSISSILIPTGAGGLTTLVPVPAGGGLINWERVNEYPTANFSDYVHTGAGGALLVDSYIKDLVPVTPVITISKVRCRALCAESSNQASQLEFVVDQLGFPASPSPTFDLSTVPILFVYDWLEDPFDSTAWTPALLNARNFGPRLNGVVSDAICYQFFSEVFFETPGERISNSSIYQPSDVIHVNQNYSVFAREERGRSLIGATTARIDYIDPDGVEGSLAGWIIDNGTLLGFMPVATNSKTGKWRFKLYAVLPGGEIMEGVEFFTNVQLEWA